MTPVEYLNVINEETKEKLIELCLDKILDSFEDDGFTNCEYNEEIEYNDYDIGEKDEEEYIYN